MSKMKASFTKGSKNKLVAVLLLVAVMIAAIGGVTATAWPGGGQTGTWPKFLAKVAGVDGYNAVVNASIDQTINLGNQEIYTATEIQGIYSLEIYSGDIKQDGTSLTIEVAENSGWTYGNSSGWAGGSSKKSWKYKSNTTLTVGDFKSAMSALTVKKNPNSSSATGEGTISLVAYNSRYSTSLSNVVDSNSTSNKDKKAYNCTFQFYNYAEGESDQDSMEIDYKSENAGSYSQTFTDYKPEGNATAILSNPTDADGGRAVFDLTLTDKGSAKKVSIGYQYIKSGSNFGSNPKIYYVEKDVKVDKFTVGSPITMTVDGLNAGQDYTIRGVIITDGKTDAPKYTNEITYRYDKPSINSFTTGGTSTVYQGGQGLMTLKMLTTFNDDSAVGKTYVGANGDTYTGPYLQADLYFTDNCVIKDGKDTSKWYKIKNQNATKVTSMDSRNSWDDSWPNVKIPGCLADYGIDTGDETVNKQRINSESCAYMLVVTDQYTGYSVTSYSDLITIDSGKPDVPQMIANVNGTDVTNLTPAAEVVTGGTGDGGTAEVQIKIGGSDDHGGSGVKQYTYSMYYLASDKVPSTYKTTESVLELLSTYTPSTPGISEYKEWTALTDLEGKDNWAELLVSKDGYYRVIARAEDNAGFISDEITGYFRVDLTAPNEPTAYLAKASGSSFAAYNNTGYTEATVWAFAYSTPKTGKDIDHFIFSTDSGLTWKNTNDIDAAYKKENKVNGVIQTVGQVEVYADSTNSSKRNVDYQIAVNLTGLGYSDYVPVIFKAVDTLGNTSTVSNKVEMRTTAKVTASATMSHDPIEVAMALGNTALEMEQNIIPLKNRSAKMINEKYYGTSGNTTMGDANFNPYLYTKNHDCTYASENGTGSCTNANCPYAVLEANGYSIYKPEWVNISGLSSGEGEKKITDWKIYDHNTKNYSNVFGPNENGRIAYIVDNKTQGDEPSYGYEGDKCYTRTRHIFDKSSSGDWSSIMFAGTGQKPICDWLFYHFNQNTNKQILFTMDTAKCHFHTYAESGFWFNTTIRKNKAETWVVSGYRVMILQVNGSRSSTWKLTDKVGTTQGCTIDIQKITDVPVEYLADQGGDDFFDDSFSGSGSVTTIKRIVPTTSTSSTIQNFMIDLTGSTCSIYILNGDVDGSLLTPKYLRTKGTAIATNVSTPRPTVDGYTIGDITDASNPYKDDTDCYGFGPVVGYDSHNCTIQTVVKYSNIKLYYNTGKTLSEVVTEPSWGEGRARYIVNLTDDVQKDFNAPVLSAQIQWRLNNDKARYVGWGTNDNVNNQKAQTITFLKRLAGESASAAEIARYGMYEDRGSNKTAKASEQELTDVATYITQQYYTELGYDVNAGLIKDQVSPPDEGIENGAVYTLDTIENMTFNVSPESLAKSSANPDFPAGRWYMVHERTDGGDIDVRSGKFSDALQTSLTLPGTYTYYFAPSQDDIDNGTLNPDEAVFNFVVHQKPVAQFTAEIKTATNGNKYVAINDTSYDPDGNGRKINGVQVDGIVKREYRWQYLTQDSSGNLQISAQSEWSTTNPNNSSLTQLIGVNELPKNSVLTFYMRVTDVTAKKVSTGKSRSTSTTYQQVAGSVSDVCQANATEGVDITYAPSSIVSMSPTVVYDTASAAKTTRGVVTVTRQSKHTQDGKYFSPSWAINLSEMGIKGENTETGYTPLTKSGNNWYYGNTLVLECVTPPTNTAYIGDGKTMGSTGGTWRVNYDSIVALAKIDNNSNGIGKHIKLQLTETTYGVSSATAANNGTEKSYITDQSARSILYDKDTTAPSAPVVISQTKIVSNGQTTYQSYEAGNYLDVTNNDKFVVINANGASDAQGVLGGYAYYFYTLDSDGNEKAPYYKLQNGKLTQVNTAALATTKVTGSSCTVEIGRDLMKENTPTDSLNMAIFAYDNQTGMSTETGGNQTVKTRINKIKLTISEPLPPAMTATNMLNQNVASIANTYGYNGGTDINGAEGTDSMTSALSYFSATDVTVKFEAKKEKYSQNSNGDLYLNSNGTEYYQDIYKAADMTGVANVSYKVKYKDKATSSWWSDTDIRKLGMEPSGVIDSSTELKFENDGVYELEACIVNGSGISSKPRTISFTIDKIAPDGLSVSFKTEDGANYQSGVWTDKVNVTATGATDTNAATAEYQYSIDGGKTWTSLGSLTKGTVSISFEESGKYNVQVRAIDKAGNAATTASNMVVCIDKNAPETPEPVVTTNSVMTDIMTEYVVSLNYDSATGKVYANQNDTLNKLDKEIAVAAGEDLKLMFYPESGYVLTKVICDGEDIFDSVETTTAGVQYLVLENVKSDYTITAEFVKTEQTAQVYRSVSRGVTAVEYAVACVYNVEDGIMPIDDTEEITEDETNTNDGESTPTEGESTTTMRKINIIEIDSHVDVRASADEVIDGGQVTITATPNNTYRIKSFKVGGTEVIGSITQVAGTRDYTYTFNAYADTDIVVIAEKIPTRKIRLSSTDCGTVTLQDAVTNEELIAENGEYTIAELETVQVYIKADQGFAATKLTINGEDAPGFTTITEGAYSYTVPAFTGSGADSGIDISATFDILGEYYTYKVSVENTPGEEGTNGSINVTGDVKVPVNGERSIILTANSGYRLSELNVTRWLNDEEKETTDVSSSDKLVLISNSPRQYRFTISGSYGEGTEISAVFEKQTYKISTDATVGGNAIISEVNNQPITLNAIPEGTSMKITASPKTGYRVKSITITEKSGTDIINTYSAGAVTSYIIPSMNSDIVVKIDFAKREVDHIETQHSITAVANGVKDKDDALADKPYRFRISDKPIDENNAHASKWSAWSDSNTITYTGSYTADDGTVVELTPNTRYYIYLQARDKVGNVSDAVAGSAYTRANMPGSTSAEALESANSATKSVALSIDTNGNPAGTEYLVYVSLSSTMADSFIANAEENDGWGTLIAGDKFIINNLDPGRWYHMQIVARNADGLTTTVSTTTTSIMLSPAAPAEGTFYFSEQASPTDGITLTWDNPPADVLGVELYRDGARIASFTSEDDVQSYIDARVDLAGDAISLYSYAYVNAAGVGSTRTAISQEYYEAKHSTTDEGKAKLEAMNALIEQSEDNAYIFSESMTYPCYQYGADDISASTTGEINGGTITVKMNYNQTDSARHQKYYLVLKAYEIDDEGNPTENEVAIADWDTAGQYRNADGTQIANETKVTQIRGELAARATWTKLSTRYVYKVFVEKICSTGKSTADDQGGQSTAGVEYTLGKQYVVTEEGYYYTYLTNSTGIDLDTVELTPWAKADTSTGATVDQIDLYTTTGWDTPVNNGYIEFNQSPFVELSETPYANNDSEKVVNNGEYLILDRSMEDQTFNIDLIAWDKDGSRTGANLPQPAIGGTISGVNGETITIEEGSDLPKTKEAAKNSPYSILFDAAGLRTGIYTDMDIWASDSDTKTEETTNGIKLVVNNNIPVTQVSGGTSKKIENDRAYTADEMATVISKTSADYSASTDLTKVALVVMADQYQATFGTSDYDTLYNYLVNGTSAAAVNTAKGILGTLASNAEYVNGSALTEKGMNTVAARMAPPVTRYVTIDQSTYNTLVNTVPEKVMENDGINENTYWLELDYAASNGYCNWITKEGDKYKVSVTLGSTDSDNTYNMKVVSNFGGNTSAQTIDFVVKEPPYATIISDQKFSWEVCSKDEYEHYQDPNGDGSASDAYTVGDIMTRYEGCFDPNTTPGANEDKNKLASSATTANGTTTYYVFKLVDNKGVVGNKYIEGEVQAYLGIHSQFEEIGVLLVTDKSFNPSTASEQDWANAITIKSPVYANQGANDTLKPVTTSGTKKFGVSGLDSNVIYYLWSYYKLENEDMVYSKSYVALTTSGNYNTAQYGFQDDKVSLEEDPGASGAEVRNKSYEIYRRADTGSASYSTIKVTPTYYKADEFGNALYDQNGEMIPITGQELVWAKDAFGFEDGSDVQLVQFTTGSSNESVKLQLKDNDYKQGHMIVRLMLTVESNETGYGYISNGGSYLDIFVQDDEDEITTFEFGIINEDESGNKIMTEIVNNGKIDHYEYQMDGLQVDYTTLTSHIVEYYNAGTGKLNSIQATVYTDKECTTQTDIFEVMINEGSLSANIDGTAKMVIQPKIGLEDGVYEAWVYLTADYAGNYDANGEKRVGNGVLIKVRQVVGQSTLSGRIYITATVPSESTRMGVSTVSLYDATTTTYSNGKFSTDPVYTTETDKYGYFEIRNILNEGDYSAGHYYIVVERDGFLTYNGIANRTSNTGYSLDIGTTSGSYLFNLRLIGGDADMNDKVDSTDLDILVKHYNNYVDAAGLSDEDNEIVKRCDFNQDGVVNALDRGFLIGNIGKSGKDYPYSTFTKIQPENKA